MAVKKDTTEGSRGSTRIREFGKAKIKYKKIKESQSHVYPASQDMEHAPQGGFAMQNGYVTSLTWRN